LIFLHFHKDWSLPLNALLFYSLN